MNDPTDLAWIIPLVVLVSMCLCYCCCDCSTNNKTRRNRVDNGGDNCANCEDNSDCYEVDDIGNDNCGGDSAGSGGGDGGSCGGSGGGSCGGGD